MKATEAAALTASVTGPDGLAPSTASSNVQVGRLYAGQLAQLSVTSIDTNDPSAQATDYSATVHWGDGTSSAGTVSGSGGVFAVTADHTYGAGGSQSSSYPVTVTLTRPDAPTVTVFDTVAVATPRLAAQAAQVWTDAAGLAAGVTLGYFRVASASLGASHFAASVDWGDGSMASSAQVQAVVPGLFRVVASHAYDMEGWRLPTVTVSHAMGGVATPALRLGGGLFVRAAPPAPEPRHRLTDLLNDLGPTVSNLVVNDVKQKLNLIKFRIDGDREGRLSVRETRALLEIGERLATRERTRPGQMDRNKIALDDAVKNLLPYADAAGFAAYLRKPASTKTMGQGVQKQVDDAIADLAKDDFDTVAGAAKTLKELGENNPIRAQVFDALDSPVLEVKKQAREVLHYMNQKDGAGMTRYEKYLMQEVISKQFALMAQVAIYRRVEGGGADHQVTNVARYFVKNGHLPGQRHMDADWDSLP